MARLRAPDGCPWDREQTPASLRPYVLEEAYEVAEAIDSADWDELRQELGDLLLQIVFLSRIAEENGRFRFEDVAEAIAAKLLRRHPHVFGDAEARSVPDVWRRWESIKQEERAGDEPRSRLEGIPRALPALVKSRLLADKAARAGFDWPDAASITDKIAEELAEVRAALRAEDPAAAGDEIGDLLFAAASLARRLGLDPEGCLARTNERFARRFRFVEDAAAARGRVLEEMSAAELDALWEEAKRGV
ncbi:MAG: nucleoside triphosphate pyrophosphohydrolase [Acidobacteria bacterium]|nr:nucleoside triphosphate pyrophosphohydrolase [Acidobacteriota bacterium]